LITIRDLIKRQISITHIEYVNIGIAFIAVTVFILLSIWFTIIPVIVPIIFIVIISILETKTKKRTKDNSK
jgi:ABC-type bacteriocin/lantibiotic exporter with double-glycine peptidase domain